MELNKKIIKGKIDYIINLEIDKGIIVKGGVKLVNPVNDKDNPDFYLALLSIAGIYLAQIGSDIKDNEQIIITSSISQAKIEKEKQELKIAQGVMGRLANNMIQQIQKSITKKLKQPKKNN